jgi:hypothetical protein
MPAGKPLLKIHREFGDQDTLVSNVMVRATEETAKASARLMSVEEHYSGGNGQLSMDFRDQMINGIFVVDQQIDKAGSRAKTKDELSDRQRVTIRKRKADDGKDMRTKSPLTDYGITVVDASIIDVVYEEKVLERLESQKKSAADEALARQNLKKAQQEAETAKALGLKTLEDQRAESLKDKEKARISAEQRKEVAVINASQEVELERQAKLKQIEILAKQRKIAEGLMVMAAARKKAAKNALDPKYVFDKEIEAQVKIMTTLYGSLGKAQLVPSIVIGGNGKGGSTNGVDFLTLLGADAAVNLQKKLTSNK